MTETLMPEDETVQVRPELRGTEAMIRAAFPNGVPEHAYLPLLVLLHECMSFRSIATVVSHCTDKSYITVYHDVMGAVSHEGPDATALEPVKKLLQRHGYDEWLASED
jgi:hypothetical protein